LRRIVRILTIVNILFFLPALCISSEDKYSVKEKKYMLDLARQTLVGYLKNKQTPSPKPEELSDNLKENRPCFVTLVKRDYGLRGCMGLFAFNRPLYKNIINRAIAAATKDYRFAPVTYEELKDIKIEISILTKPKELSFNAPEDLLTKLNTFQDGVILYTEYGNSTYLPQVWEQLPDKEVFLSSLCRKHGAPGNYWKTNYTNLRVEIYKAIRLEEESYKSCATCKD
jgi:AmmeMemoRadiSam system protein A